MSTFWHSLEYSVFLGILLYLEFTAQFLRTSSACIFSRLIFVEVGPIYTFFHRIPGLDDGIVVGSLLCSG